MKRSFINARLRDAIAFCWEHRFRLPQWATWTPGDWRAAGPEADEVRRCRLGWDVTDFGSGDYANVGLLAFTIRNGLPGEAGTRDVSRKDYCEKLLLIGDGQKTPMHFHWHKMEDIINRGGGLLVMRLWHCIRETEAADQHKPVVVSVDGLKHTFEPGQEVVLRPGESITLPPSLYHEFYARPGSGMVLGGEVSRVNDDANDNRFSPALPRFSKVEEDEPPAYLLCNEYPPAQ